MTRFNGLPTKVKLNMLGVPYEIAVKINDCKQQYTLDTIKNNAIIMEEKVELHAYLKEIGVKVACVTNSIRETAEEMLRATGQLKFMDAIISNEDVQKNKPYPDCYNTAVHRIGVDPSRCLCVEDSLIGIEAAAKSIVHHLWAVKNTTQVTKVNFLNRSKDTK